MKCVICRTGETKPGTATVTMHRDNTVVLLKNVPADVCQNCGEYYLNEPVAEKAYAQVQAAADRGAEVEIAEFVG